MLPLVSRRRGRLPRVGDVDDEDAVAASGDDELDGLGVAQVLLDVDLVRGDVEEVAGLHVLVVLELVAPVEADAAFEHVDRRLAVAVVVGAGVEAGWGGNPTGPDGGGAARLLGDAGLARHAGGLGGVAIPVGGTDDPDPCHGGPLSLASIRTSVQAAGGSDQDSSGAAMRRPGYAPGSGVQLGARFSRKECNPSCPSGPT